MSGKRLFFLIGTAIVLGALCRAFVVGGISIATASMEPTLTPGTYLFAEKVSYLLRSPRRGEVVVLRPPVESEREVVKRIIAVGGDTIEIRKKKVFLNDRPLTEPYARYTRPQEILMGDNLGPWQVPEGYVFVMGDNRDWSKDSRDWRVPRTQEPLPFVPLRNIRARVLFF
ncbi:MAG: signal peptidase I [Elusimicrobia bacterium]|nr:signal peptidase I [Elusimicrobiota bacterium]